MSAYLERLKQVEGAKYFQHIPNTEPTKPTEPPFDGFVGTGTGQIVKKNADAEIDTHPEQPPVKPLSIQDRQREARRQKVIAMLEAAPDTLRAVYPDTDSDPDNVILAIAIRHLATFEMAIPKATYDPWRLLELIERMGMEGCAP